MELYKLPKFELPKLKSPRFLKFWRNKFFWLVISTIFISSVCGLLAGALSGSYFYLEVKDHLSKLKIELPEPQVVEKIIEKETVKEYQPQTTQEEKIIQAVKEASPAVVSIVITKDVPIIEQYYISPFEGEWPFSDLQVPQYRQKGKEKKTKKEIKPSGFGRIAATVAKQVLFQKIREAEKSANNFLLYSKLDKKAAYVFLLSNDINFTPARVKKLSLIRIWRPDILLWQKKTKSWSEPIITVNTKSSSKYKLSVEGVSSDYILYFAESYFPGWELTLHLADGSKIKLDESRHIKANSFANAWFIKAQDSRGESNYNIDIEFSQQGLILKGALISLLGLGLVVLFYLRIKK